MAKKAFLVFTIVMVFITGTLFYAIIAKAKNEIRIRNKKIVTDIPQITTPTPIKCPPLPDAAYIKVEDSDTQKNTLTNGQKYYTSLSAENAHNILLVGLDPTYANFDTMVIVSIHEKDNAVLFINLPRDIYIDYNNKWLSILKEESIEFYTEKGSRKLNAAPAFGKKIRYTPENERFPGKNDMNFITDVIYEIFDIEVHDYVKVQTNGFRELVDFFGGIEIDVPYFMHYEDPEQNLYIHLEPGLQKLNGTQAEGFVRFRQGFTRDGKRVYYSRTDNTFTFLKAFYKQHMNIKNLSRIGKIYEVVQKNTSTSVNNLNDIYWYSRLAKKVLEDDYSFETVEILCEETKNIGGALYDMIKTN